MKLLRGMALVTLLLLLAAACFAQARKDDPMAQFREQHKFTFELTELAGRIAAIDKDSKHTLSAAQAKQVLAVLQPLRSKPKLTQDQAKAAVAGLTKICTADQLKAMAKIDPRLRAGQKRPDAGKPADGKPGVAKPAGDRPPAGQRPNASRMDPKEMKDFNPFYVTKAAPGDQLAARRAQRWNDLFAALEKTAKTAPAAAKPAAAPAKKAKSGS